ncbi:MAG: heme o synthase [Gammaproteobacteria bacterium]|nr:heme o synthase [Gammaproteobacteria bacterium]
MSKAESVVMEHTGRGSWRDYFEMCKPKVVALLILTSVVGTVLASPAWGIQWDVLIIANIGIALAAAGGAAVNHIVEWKSDAGMKRTEDRPLASGRVSLSNAIMFAMSISALSMVILVVYINVLTAVLTFASLIGYAVIYTMYLKRATPQNIVIGGLAGAMPPLLGWTAVTNSIDPYGLLLVLIIFTWTPPHFWALAIHRRDDYAKVSIPMLPVTHGIKYTKLAIVAYTILMVIVTLLPYLAYFAGWIYLSAAVLLGGFFMYKSLELFFTEREKAAIQTFVYSINYLMLLFIALVADHYILS